MKYRDYPAHLEIESTNRCNLACIMCPRRKMTRPVMDMSWDIFVKIVDESRGKSLSSYVHMIGEPLLHPLIVEMVNYVHDARIRSSISTNCMLLKGDLADRLIESRLDEFTLCLDGTTEEIYSKYRVGGDFQRVVRNIDAFIQKRRDNRYSNMQLELQLIKMAGNTVSINDFIKKYHESIRGIGRISIKEYSTFAGFVDDLNIEDTPSRKPMCSKFMTHIAFHSDGDCVTCCRDFDKFTVVGNVKDHSVYELWHSAKYNAYRDLFQQRAWNEMPLCKNC